MRLTRCSMALSPTAGSPLSAPRRSAVAVEPEEGQRVVALHGPVVGARTAPLPRLVALRLLLVVVVLGLDPEAVAQDVVRVEPCVWPVVVVRGSLPGGHVELQPLEAGACVLAGGPGVAAPTARGRDRARRGKESGPSQGSQLRRHICTSVR